MWRRSLAVIVFALAGSFGGGLAAEAACVAVVTGNRAGEASTTHGQSYDGGLSTYFCASTGTTTSTR